MDRVAANPLSSKGAVPLQLAPAGLSFGFESAAAALHNQLPAVAAAAELPEYVSTALQTGWVLNIRQ